MAAVLQTKYRANLKRTDLKFGLLVDAPGYSIILYRRQTRTTAAYRKSCQMILARLPGPELPPFRIFVQRRPRRNAPSPREVFVKRELMRLKRQTESPCLGISLLERPILQKNAARTSDPAQSRSRLSRAEKNCSATSIGASAVRYSTSRPMSRSRIMAQAARPRVCDKLKRSRDCDLSISGRP